MAINNTVTQQSPYGGGIMGDVLNNMAKINNVSAPTYSGVAGSGIGSPVPAGQPQSATAGSSMGGLYAPGYTPPSAGPKPTNATDPQTGFNVQIGNPSLNPQFSYSPTPASQAPATQNASTGLASSIISPTIGSNGSPVTPYAQSLLGIGTQGSQAYNDAIAKLQADETQQGADINSIKGAGTDSALQTGQMLNQANYWNTRLNADQNAILQQQNQQGQQITALNSGGGLVSPGNTNVTAPAGQVTTNSYTGQQYSNPALAPIGSQQFYSPQPQGTPGQPGTAGQPSSYTIQQGDSLSKIAAANGTTVEALAALNGISDPNKIQAGTSLKIPAAPQGNPFTAGQIQAQTQLGATYQGNVSAYTQAGALVNGGTNPQTGQPIQGINQILQQNPQLNPSNFKDVNTALQLINGKVSNVAYQNLSNKLNEFAQTLAPILGVGGQDTSDYRTRLATMFADGANQNQSLQQIIQGILETAYLKIGAQPSGATMNNPQAPTSFNMNSSTPSGAPTNYNW